MEGTPYKISQIDEYVFEFRSIGRKKLLKQVEFTLINSNQNIYNLSLGTVLENGEVDYEDSSNNGNIVTVFATIIVCIKAFNKIFPKRVIYFRGNTAQKSRGYNEILRRHYYEFSKDFHIFWVRVIDNFMEKFDVLENYSGFYLANKI